MKRLIWILAVLICLLPSCGAKTNLTYLYNQSGLHRDLREADYVIAGTVTELQGTYKPTGGTMAETYFVPAVVQVDRVFADRVGDLGDSITIRQTCYTHYVSPEPLPHLEIGKQYFFCLYVAPDDTTIIIGGSSAAEITGEGTVVSLLTQYADNCTLYETKTDFFEAAALFISLPQVREPAFSPMDADVPWTPENTGLYAYPVLTEFAAVQQLYLVDGCRSAEGKDLSAEYPYDTYTEAVIICRSGFPYYRFTYPDGTAFYTPAVYPEYLT